MRTVARRFLIAAAAYSLVLALSSGSAWAQGTCPPGIGNTSQTPTSSYGWVVPSITRSWGYFVPGFDSWAAFSITAPKNRYSAYLLREGRGHMK